MDLSLNISTLSDYELWLLDCIICISALLLCQFPSVFFYTLCFPETPFDTDVVTCAGVGKCINDGGSVSCQCEHGHEGIRCRSKIIINKIVPPVMFFTLSR